MPRHDLYIGSYWGPRRESIEQCAVRVHDCLSRLSLCSDLFSTLYDKGKSRQDALERCVFPGGIDQIIPLLLKGRNWYDSPRRVIEDLGFRIDIWNGVTRPHAASFKCHCGSYTDVADIWNTAILEPPDNVSELAAVEDFVCMLRGIAAAFEPEWGGVISYESREARKCPIGPPVVDWMFYINRTEIDRSKLPSSASVHPVENLGTIIVVQDHPIDPTNPQDLENIKMVESAVGLHS